MKIMWVLQLWMMEMDKITRTNNKASQFCVSLCLIRVEEHETERPTGK